MAKHLKSPSEGEATDKPKRARKPLPEFSTASSSTVMRIAYPTVGNVLAALRAVSGESARKNVKPTHLIVQAALDDRGGLGLEIAQQSEGEQEQW